MRVLRSAPAEGASPFNFKCTMADRPYLKRGKNNAYKMLKKDVDLIERLAGVASQQIIANFFGIHINTLRAIMDRQPEVEAAYLRGKANTTIQIGEALISNALGGDFRSQKFYLATQAGWIEKQDIHLRKTDDLPAHELPEDELYRIATSGSERAADEEEGEE